ncbi:MAG: hypothetical protein CMO80_07995 [Verrucomicrobiales bacterium]|nr:hypothetical protein [Verrucomicrobiales bacterium]
MEPAELQKNCFGHCQDCGREHSLGEGNAHEHARALMEEFQRIRRLDYTVPDKDADPRLSFDHLFPGERGHMFGVLECRDEAGETVVLRAFSSLHDGVRTVDGWVPPILSDEVFNELVLPGQIEIKRLTRAINALDHSSQQRAKLSEERKKISQGLMPEIHSRYHLRNFRGETRLLEDAFIRPHGLPGGVGDCCGPKLLQHAAVNGLGPVGLAEFYWGGPHKSGTRQPGRFYPCCEEKCQPILGFMLCGLENV